MERRFFSGSTIEQAVLAAARHHGISPERIAYSQRDKRHGFLKIRRRVVIEVNPQEPEKKEAATVALSSREVESVAKTEVEEYAPVHIGDAEEAIGSAMERILRLAGIEAAWEISHGDGTYAIDLSGVDSERMISGEGKFLTSAEHLLPRLVRGLHGEGLFCKVDCEAFQSSHEEELQSLAQRVAGEVLEEGESRLLDPMNPADRRVVHLSLANKQGIETESEGAGYYKRVAIIPCS